MTTATNLNDMKVRLLQLKSLGYDKLLNKEELNSQLTTIEAELVAIAGEVKAITNIIIEAESGITENTPENTPENTHVDENQNSESTQQIGPELPPQTNGNKLPPAPKVTKATKTPPKKDKVKKTSHKIGRRA